MNTKTMIYSVGLAVMFSASGAQAASFQAEAGFQNDTTDIDSNNDYSIMSVGGTYYLQPVQVSGPHAEAAFLAKASGVKANVGTVDATIATVGVDGNTYGVGVDYVLPANDIKLGLDLQSVDISALGSTIETSMTTLEVGKYLDDRKYVGFSYGTGTNSITGFSDTDVTDISIDGKWLLNQAGKDINLEATVAQESLDNGTISESNNVISIGGDYYLDNSLSVGMGYKTNSGDDTSEEGSTIAVHAEKFITDVFSVEMIYSQFSADTATDETAVSFTIGGRF